MPTVKQRVRRASRQVRRIGVGTRGLGITPVADWLWTRTRRAQPGTVDNSSLTWVVAEPARTTLVWIHNYWSDAYGFGQVRLDATLLAGDGSVLARRPIELGADATEVVDVRDLCRDADVALPFEGQLLLVLSDERLMPGRPVQVFAEYLTDDGAATGVHGQYGYLDTPVGQVVGAMRVESDATRRTAVVVTNGYRPRTGRVTAPMQVSVFRADGARRDAELARLAALESRRVYLDDVVPDLETFLGGHPGHAYVQLPFPTTRLATFVEDRADGTIVVNHGTVNWRFQAQPGVAPDWHDADPVASLPVLVGEHRDTRVTLPNGWGPVAADFGARLSVYDGAGVLVADATREVPVDTLVEVSMRELLGAVPGSDFVGHAEVRLVPRGLPDERPALFEVLVAIVDDDRMLAEVQVGGGFFNSDAPADAAFPAIPRTRVFSRVRIDEPATTWVYLAHPRSGADAGAPAAPRLTLLDADGQRSVIRDLEIAPHGCVFSDVRDLFPEWSTVLGPSGRGTLRVRDVTARLYGYSITGDAGAPTVAIDHLIGG